MPASSMLPRPSGRMGHFGAFASSTGGGGGVPSSAGVNGGPVSRLPRLQAGSSSSIIQGPSMSMPAHPNSVSEHGGGGSSSSLSMRMHRGGAGSSSVEMRAGTPGAGASSSSRGAAAASGTPGGRGARAAAPAGASSVSSPSPTPYGGTSSSSSSHRWRDVQKQLGAPPPPQPSHGVCKSKSSVALSRPTNNEVDDVEHIHPAPTAPLSIRYNNNNANPTRSTSPGSSRSRSQPQSGHSRSRSHNRNRTHDGFDDGDDPLSPLPPLWLRGATSAGTTPLRIGKAREQQQQQSQQQPQQHPLHYPYDAPPQRMAAAVARAQYVDDSADDLDRHTDETPPSGADRFTSLPPMRLRTKASTTRSAAISIAPRALASPPPHERRIDVPVTFSMMSDDLGQQNDLHEAQMSRSASSGATAYSTAHASAFRQPLTSSTSTVTTSATSNSTLGGDEMIMALLASQAAVDCDTLPIGAWDDVEAWKKELSQLSARLEALQARHQREVKILTAARTLQKLNQANKRLSKQTMESLEQSEKRAETAEKEVLVLRDREAALRRRLMEHWAGVMAWEVRRLERSASEASARYETHASHAAELEAGRAGSTERSAASAASLEQDLAAEREQGARRAGRIAELEEMVLELGRRERALEDDAKRGNDTLAGHADERQQWQRDRDAWLQEKDKMANDADDELDSAREHWGLERDQLMAQIVKLTGTQSTMVRAADADEQMDSARDAWGMERDQLMAQIVKLTGERERSKAAEGGQLAQVVAERDQLLAQRSEFETMHVTVRDAWLAERDQLITEHNTQRDHLVSEHNTLMEERNDLVKAQEQHTATLRSHDSSTGTWNAERELLVAKNERLKGDLAKLAEEHDTMHSKATKNTDAFETERSAWLEERDALLMEKEQLAAECDLLNEERGQLVASAQQSSALTKNTTGKITATLSAVLERNVSEAGIMPALDEVVAILEMRDSEVASLREEIREVTRGLEEEVRRLNADRDRWKAKAEDAALSQRGAQAEMTELVRKIRAQNDQVNSLTATLQGDPGAARSLGSMGSNPALESKATTLEAELSNINARLTKLWVILPTRSMRDAAGLTDPAVVSPNSAVDFTALQRAYAGPGTTEKYGGIDDLVARVRDLVDDGRLMVERMARMETDKERHKANAAKAAHLVDHSREALTTYQHQVAELQERLDKREAEDAAAGESAGGGGGGASAAAELESLRSDLEDAMAHNQRLEDDVRHLNGVNESLSQRTLTLADEAEADKRALTTKLAGQMDELRRAAEKANADADAERSAGSLQRVQLMDELNSLQEEVAELRGKLRAR